MVFLSLVTSPPFCRWLNVALGAFYTAIMLLTMPGAWWFYITLGLIEVVLSLLIVVYAWRWPRSRRCQSHTARSADRAFQANRPINASTSCGRMPATPA